MGCLFAFCRKDASTSGGCSGRGTRTAYLHEQQEGGDEEAVERDDERQRGRGEEADPRRQRLADQIGDVVAGDEHEGIPAAASVLGW